MGGENKGRTTAAPEVEAQRAKEGSGNPLEDVSRGDAGADGAPAPRESEWWGDRWDEAGHYQGVVFRVTSMDEPQRVMIDSDLERLYRRIVAGVEQ